MMYPKTGKAVPCSAWTYSKNGASFVCDDSGLDAATQLPYRIDPDADFLDGGSYSADAWCCSQGGTIWDDAHVNFDTTGVIPDGAGLGGIDCGFDIDNQYMANNDSVGCNVRIPMMSISHSDLMPISSERSDAELSQCESVIDISQEFLTFPHS